jgi:hypothetical protein
MMSLRHWQRTKLCRRRLHVAWPLIAVSLVACRHLDLGDNNLVGDLPATITALTGLTCVNFKRASCDCMLHWQTCDNIMLTQSQPASEKRTLLLRHGMLPHLQELRPRGKQTHFDHTGRHQRPESPHVRSSCVPLSRSSARQSLALSARRHWHVGLNPELDVCMVRSRLVLSLEFGQVPYLSVQ